MEQGPGRREGEGPGEAVKAARGKADALLGTLFSDRPPVINVQEQTTVRYPESLYHSFTNSYEEAVSGDMRRNVPYIHAYRPRNTYTAGYTATVTYSPASCR